MKKENIIKLFVITCIGVAGTVFLLVSKRTESKFDFNYGDGLNDFRQSNKIPLVEADWRYPKKDSTTIDWMSSSRKVDRVNPYHLYKIAHLENGQIVNEIDAIHFESDSHIAYRLIASTYLNSNRVDSITFELIIYDKDDYKLTETRKIGLIMADSVVDEWRKISPDLKIDFK